jgi:CubicO group peptidase (beta-lactamase class C family)
VIAFEVGDGPVIQAVHFPDADRADRFSSEIPMNVLSAGKLFTAVLIMQLIEDGKISLQTRLSDLLTFEELALPLRSPYDKEAEEALEKAQENYAEITIEHLLSHTAGLGKVLLHEGSEEVRDAKIGEYGYSNYGFQLLARIVGKHSKEGRGSDHETGFLKTVEERIFIPAGMSGAIAEMHNPSDPTSRPHRFDLTKKEERIPISDDVPEPYAHGNGCWRMPAEDLMKFGMIIRQCLSNPPGRGLILKQTFQTMLGHIPPLGFMVAHDEQETVRGYGHPGGGPGQSSFIHTWLTDPPITAVVLSNYPNGANVQPWLDDLLPSLMPT